MARHTHCRTVLISFTIFFFGLFPIGPFHGGLFHGSSARADVVTWVPDADGQWEDATNWSSDPALPGSDDDVTIDVGGATVRTVTLGAGEASVQSLTCEENLDIVGGDLTIGSGGGTVNGALTIGNWQRLTVSGGSFSANGPTSIDDANLYAVDGGRLALPNATSYDPVSWRPGTFKAGDEGSLLDLSALTTLSGTGALSVRAHEGGKVDLSQLTETSGVQLGVSCGGTGTNGTGAVVDLTNLRTITAGLTTGFDVSDGGTVRIPNLTTLDGATLKLSGSGAIDTAQLTSVDQSNFYVYDGATLALPGVSSYDPVSSHTLLAKFEDSLLDLSTLTTVAGTGTISVKAEDGGKIDLSQITETPGIRLEVDCWGTGTGGTGAVVDLTNLRTLTPNSRFGVRYGGTIRMPNVTAFNKVTLEISGAGAIDTDQFTNVDESSLYASDGATLTLPNVSSFNPVSWSRMHANAEGSLLDLSTLTTIAGTGKFDVGAYRGGKTDLSQIAETPGVILSVNCGETGSAGTRAVVDLANLRTVSRDSSISVRDGGTVRIPNVTTLNGVSLTVQGDGRLDTGQLTELISGSLKLDGTTTVDLSGLTNVDQSSLSAYNGATLTLPNVSSYDPVSWRTLQAEHEDSLLDLSTLTTVSGTGAIFVRAYSGGKVDLSQITETPGVQLDVHCWETVAGSADAVVDLSNLRTTEYGGSLDVRSGGIIRIPNLTTLHGTDLIVRGTGTIDTDQFTNVDDCDLWAYDGATLALPNVSDYALVLSRQRLMWAEDEGSLLDLSTLRTLSGSGKIRIEARNGGKVDLSQISETPGVRLEVNCGGTGTGGTGAAVDLTGLQTITPESSFNVYDGGTVRLGPATIRLVETDVFGSSGGTLEGGTLELVDGSEVYGSMTIDATLVNGETVAPGMENGDVGLLDVTGDYVQTVDGLLQIEAVGVDNSDPKAPQFDQVRVGTCAALDGTLEIEMLEAFTGDYGATMTILEAAGGISGFFDDVEITSGVEDKTFEIGYASDRVTVTVVLPGDVDGDGFVGSADLDLVRGNWNQSTRPGDFAAGDLSGDGFVGSADLDILRNAWNDHIPEPASVPEPSTAVFLAAALVLLFRHPTKRGGADGPDSFVQVR